MPVNKAFTASQKGSFLPEIKSPSSACALDAKHARRPLSRSSRVSEVSWGTEDTTMSECICTICDCGKHACPVHKWQPTDFQGNSRYREDFPAHPLAMRKKLGPDRTIQMIPADPDHFKSKYLEDFQAFTPDPAKSMKPKETAAAPVPFAGTTTNREVYTPKQGNYSKRRPPAPPKDDAPFDGTTTHQQSFQPHPEVRPRDPLGPKQHRIVTAPFDGHTAYTDDYPEHDVGPLAKRPPHAPYDYGPPRELGTEQRGAFTPKPIHVCPVLKLSKKEPSMKTGHIHYTKKNPNNGPFSPTLR